MTFTKTLENIIELCRNSELSHNVIKLESLFISHLCINRSLLLLLLFCVKLLMSSNALLVFLLCMCVCGGGGGGGGRGEAVFSKPGEKCHTLVITIDIHLIVVC